MAKTRTRLPRAYRLDHPGLDPEEARPRVLIVEEPEAPFEPEPEIASERRRRAPWLSILVSALGGLALLGLGLAVDGLIRDLFATSAALGWLSLGLAIVATLAFLVLVSREVAGILSERRIETLRQRAEEARSAGDGKEAEAVVAALAALYAGRPETARARARIEEMSGAIIDAPDRLAIAEELLLAPLDRAARRIVANAAKQVSLVTAVSPRAVVDVGFVLYTSLRVVRRIAALYGARPGLLGFLRLSGNVLSHLAVTGGVAVGDGLLQQVMGLGLAARVSARLGEGVLNGLLTARVGIAAIEVCRPLAFGALPAPTISDVAAGLFERAGPGAAES